MDNFIPNNDLIKLTKLDFIEYPAVLKMAEEAHVALGILNYRLKHIPCPEIFLDTMYMQEAKASSDIENIETTNDELFKAILGSYQSPETEKVLNYTKTIRYGKQLLEEKLMLNREDLVNLHDMLGADKKGIRKNSPKIETSYTRIKNRNTGEIIYTPPHGEKLLNDLLDDMLEYVYNDDLYTTHPLIKIALAHGQFEKIHPFYDGNGRFGRLVSILFLMQKKYISYPILYLSKYINCHKSDYYHFLRDIDDGDYLPFVEFMLTSFYRSAQKTLALIDAITDRIAYYSSEQYINEERQFKGHTEVIKEIIKIMFEKVYFRRNDLNRLLSKDTITSYLTCFKEAGLIEEETLPGKGNPKIYKNIELLRIIEEENENDTYTW